MTLRVLLSFPSYNSVLWGKAKEHNNWASTSFKHGRILTSFFDTTTGFLVFVFLKIVVKATLETVLVAAETFFLFSFFPCLGECWLRVTSGPVDIHVRLPRHLIPNLSPRILHIVLMHLTFCSPAKGWNLWRRSIVEFLITNACFSLGTFTSFVGVCAKTVP